MVSIPTTEKNLCDYVAYLAQSNLKHQSIKCYLSAIRHLQIMPSESDPFKEQKPLFEYVVWGIKSEQAQATQRVHLPITPVVLLRIHQVWERDSTKPNSVILWATCTFCFFDFLRSGEITVSSAKDFDPGAHLAVGDVTLDSRSAPTVAQLNIKASKTEPFLRGVSIFLGRTGHQSAMPSVSSGRISGGTRKPARAFIPFPGWAPAVTGVLREQSEGSAEEGGAGSVKVRKA